MTWGYTFTPSIWTSVLTAVLLLMLCAYSVRRRSVPGALPFAVGCVFAGLWAAGSALELAAADVATKVFWVKFQAVWQLPATIAVTCFVLEYTAPGRYLNRRNLVLVSIPPLLFALLILTDPVHHLFWRDFQFESGVIPVRAPLNWVAMGFGYGLGVINLCVLGWLFVRSPEHRWPVVVILSAQIGARIVYAVDATNIVRSPVPLDVISLTYLFTAYAVALFGFGLFNPMPLARRMVMAQMRDGAVVLDPQGRVATLNSAAESILGVPTKRALGRPARDLLPSSAPLLADLQAGQPGQTELSLERDEEVRHYLVEGSVLTDWRGLAIGCLLLLHDVTEERQAQAQALQTQWAEATLQERELLAQELHDGLVQSLGFLNLQAQAAQVHLQSGEREAADESLKRLAEVALTVHGDARQLIDNLLTVSLPSEGFCSTLRGAVRRFEEQTGVPVQLEIDADAESACDPAGLPPAAGVQLLRIVQEALANVRKHAECPSQVSLELRAEPGLLHLPGQMQLTITDDGTGFEPALASADGKHFGLRVMRQRAARIGGQISVRSAPGEGTSVKVCVPLGADDEELRKRPCHGSGSFRICDPEARGWLVTEL